MKRKLGIYAGSFKPFHLGHLDIIKQASKVFDDILVAKGNNTEKNINISYPFPVTFLKNLDVYSCEFNGLLIDLIKIWEDEYDVTIVRGLRSGVDLEYEQNFAAFLRGMYPHVKIVAFYCDPKFRHISSSALRAIQKISEEEYQKYVVTD